MSTDLVLGLPPRPGPAGITDGLLLDHPVPAARELDATATADTAADTLAAAAHAEGFLLGRAADAAGVLRLLAATVAALRGDDVRAAWTAPDAARLAAVPLPAVHALREVLVHVVVADVAAVSAELADLGLG